MFTLARRVLLVAAIAPAILVAACGEEEAVDPYVYGTLDQVTRGHIQSEQYKKFEPVYIAQSAHSTSACSRISQIRMASSTLTFTARSL